jgi:hypothetical protein
LGWARTSTSEKGRPGAGPGARRHEHVSALTLRRTSELTCTRSPRTRALQSNRLAEAVLRLGGIYTFWGTQASAFLNAGIAEDTDPLSSFRLGGGLRLRAEFPLMLHGYNVEEVFARRFVLVNLGYRFPIWPGQDRVHLQLLGDYARVDAQFEFKY